MRRIPVGALCVCFFLSSLFFAAPTRAAESAETLLAISINGKQVSIGSVVLRESDGTYAISAEDAAAWRLSPPAQAREQYRDHTYIPLRLIPDVAVRFNDELQRLELHVPARYFQATEVDELRQTAITPERGNGAFLNYDVREQDIGGQPALINGIFDAGSTLGNGVLDTSYVGNAGADVTGFRRLSSSWQTDDIVQHRTFRIGDATSNAGALVVGEPFFGVQLVSNFSTAPGMSLYPRPTVAGSTDTPATADVYVDGRLAVRQDLPSGPFQIQNIPVAGDAGNVQVVVKNASGQEQVISTPYYGPSTLLRSGLTTFSWGAGLEATPNSSGSERYGDPLVEFFDQRGLSNRFTGELDGMFAGDGRALSGGGTWLVPRVGTLDLAVSAAAGTGVGGSRFDYEYLSRRLHFGFGVNSLQQNSTLILTPGISAPTSVTHQEQAHLSYQTSAHSSISLELSNQRQNVAQNGVAQNNPSRTLETGYSASLGNTQLNFTFFKTAGSFSSNAFSLTAMVPLNTRRRAYVTAATQDGRDASNVVLTADPVFTGDRDEPGYALTLGSSDSALQLTDWTKDADFQAGFSRIDDLDESQFEARGSIADVDRRLFASRSILGSYGVAEVPDHPNVRVYADGQYVGKTDRDGEVLLPNLQPYQNNAVSLESNDFPVAANVDSFKKTAVPYYRSPVTVRFPVRGDGGVVVHVKLPDGSYLPAGATLSANGFSWPVLDQGAAYLEGVAPGPLTLNAEAGDARCLAAAVIPKNVADIPDIGEVVCRTSR